MKNSILITGGAGFIGSHLAQKFYDENYQVIILDNLFRGSLENINSLIEKGVIFIELDLVKKEDADKIVRLIAKYKPQIIAHYAAINGTQYFYDIPHLVAEVNSISTYNLLNYLKEVQLNCSDYKPDFFFASTSEVYGEPFELPSTEEAITYLRIDEKRDSYAAAKLMSEFYVKLFCESLNLNWMIFRIFNVYGPKMIGTKYGQVIPEFITRLKDGEYPLNIFGSGNHTRSFTYIDDHVDMTYKAVSNATKNQVYNLGNDAEISIVDLAKLIMECMDLNPKFNFLDERSGDHLRRKPSINKLLKEIDKHAFITLKEGVLKILNYKN
jgi:UDP-glucuronate decarboxylase